MKWIVLVALAVAGVPEAHAQVTAIEHARIHDGNGRKIDDGTVIFAGAMILALGPSNQIAVPAGARLIDGRGTWLTPGLVDAEARTGLVDVWMEAATVETELDGRYDAVRAAFTVLDGLNPRSSAIPIARIEGITTTVLAPRGGLVSGQGAVIRLDGDSVDQMRLRAPAGVWASVAASGREAAYGARGGVLLRLRELFDDVRQYARRRQEFERNQMRKVSASRLDLEALVPVIEGKLRLVVEAHRASDIQAVLRWAREEKIRIVLSGCDEGWMVGPEIAAARVPVIIYPLADLPQSFERLGARLDNAARLAHAGVKIVLASRESEPDQASRTLRLATGNAVANGLAWEEALAAVTRVPAEVFEVSTQVGTIAPGKSADLVLWTGDPFEPLTRPKQLFIAGREIPLRSRQTELRDRYSDLRSARPAP